MSFGSIFARLASEAAANKSLGFSLLISALRMGMAALLLLPAWRTLPGTSLEPGAWRYAVLAGVFLALHFATWITSLSFTTIAASTALVTSTPIWIALLSWLWLGQVPARLTTLGIGLALGGALIIGLGSGGSTSASNPALGNLLALAGAVAGSLYFMLGREAQQRGFGIGLYAAAAYGVSALLLLPMPLAFGSGYAGYPAMAYAWIALMALLPQLVGHTSLNWAVKQIPPVLVSLVVLFEPIGASLLGFLIFAELPAAPVFLGGAVLLVGVAIAVWGNRGSGESPLYTD